MNGAEILVKSLEKAEVEVIFGIPGTHTLEVYDKLINSKIKTIQTTQEQSAGFMADAYGRVSHKPGVVFVTSGPGALNTVNSTAQAYVESSPTLIISSQCNQKLWRKGCYHELKTPKVQVKIFKDITKYSKQINDVEEIANTVNKAIFETTNGRFRPTYIEIPENLFGEEYKNITPKTTLKKQSFMPKRKQITKLVKEIEMAQSPLLFVGGGILASNANKELMQLAKSAEIPIVTTIMGKSACPTSFEYNLGIGSGILADEEAKIALNQTDLIIAIGTRFDEVATGFFTLKINSKLVRIDIDQKEFNRNYPELLSIRADAKLTLKEILKEVEKKKIKKNIKIKKKVKQTLAELTPEYIIERIMEQTDQNAIFIGDSGNSAPWLAGCKNEKGALILTPSGYNSMGFSIPGAIGAKVASPKSTVVALCGDGSFLMTGLELLTAIKYNIKIIAIVLHESKYNILQLFQKIKHDGRYKDTEIKTLEFAEFMNKNGALGIKIEKIDEIENAIKEAMKYNGPSLIEVKLTAELIPPILKKIKTNA